MYVITKFAVQMHTLVNTSLLKWLTANEIVLDKEEMPHDTATGKRMNAKTDVKKSHKVEEGWHISVNILVISRSNFKNSAPEAKSCSNSVVFKKLTNRMPHLHLIVCSSHSFSAHQEAKANRLESLQVALQRTEQKRINFLWDVKKTNQWFSEIWVFYLW